MSEDRRHDRIFLIGMICMFLAVGAMLLFVSIRGGGIAGD